MKHTTRLFLPLTLIAIFILSACAPAASSPTSEAIPASAIPAQGVTATVPAATLPPVQPEATATLIIPPTEAPPFVPTSRGPDLHATDPTTVNLASGQLQLVEFFRFTWGTCRSMASMVHGLEVTYYGKILFTYLDASDPRTEGFQRALGFRYQPEFYLLDGNGNLLKKFVGYVSQAEFETIFAQYVP
jgi:hypothetical protein